jgi:hypothetical protein
MATTKNEVINACLLNNYILVGEGYDQRLVNKESDSTIWLRDSGIIVTCRRDRTIKKSDHFYPYKGIRTDGKYLYDRDNTERPCGIEEDNEDSNA